MIYRDIYAGPAANYGTSTFAKMYIAIHNTSNTASAKNEAAYARRRTDNISSHYYADGVEIIQMLDTNWQAWHAGSTRGNQRGIAYEITGVNGWTRAQWLANVDWDKLARQIARDCTTHNIDAQQLTIAQMNDGRSTGIVTHDQMRRAWGGTTHTDPGVNFLMDHLLALVRAQLDGDNDVATADLPEAQDDQLAAIDRRMRALMRMELKPYLIGWTDSKTDTETMQLAVVVDRIDRNVAEIKNMLIKLTSPPASGV